MRYNNFRELRQAHGMTQKGIGEFFGIPRRTIEDWDSGKSQPASYLMELMIYRLDNEPRKQIDSKYEESQ